MNMNLRKGFTLIEILIVVAIIAILASVVLVGLGPTQQAGRDARRSSDLHEVQNGLELYYNRNGSYPVLSADSGISWGPAATAGTFSNKLTAAGVGVNAVPNDPNSGSNYIYAWSTGGVSYELQATLEDASSSVFNNYAAPQNFTPVGYSGGTAPNCTASKNYCISL